MAILRVIIKYAPGKRAHYSRLRAQELAQNLRDDLDIMRLPHPPTTSIKLSDDGGVEFSWETTKESPLYKVVAHLVHQQDNVEVFRQRKESCQIETIILRSRENESTVEGGEFPKSRRRSLAARSEAEPHSYERKPLSQKGAENSSGNSIPRIFGTDDNNTLLAEPASRHNEVYRRRSEQSYSAQKRTISTIESVQAALLGINYSLDAGKDPDAGAQAQISKLLDDLHAIKQKLSALATNGANIEKQLRLSEVDRENGSVDLMDAIDLEPEMNSDMLHSKLESLQHELQEETKLRERAEWRLSDVLRECREPVIVPQLYSILGLENKDYVPSCSS